MFSNDLCLDSEQTVMNQLRDTFSCKTSESSNILRINTSTYSVNRTADHISQKLQEACQRLYSISTSVHRNKERNTINKSDNSVVKNIFMKSQKQQQHERSCMKHQHLQQASQSSLIEIIDKLKNEIANKDRNIEKLEEQLVSKESAHLLKQQKYLKNESIMIIEINRLKNLLAEKHDQDTKRFNQKVQLERAIDEYKVRFWELQTKLKTLQESRANWAQKQARLSQALFKYNRKLQKQDLTGKGLTQKKKKDKSLLEMLIRIMEIEESTQDTDMDKQNHSGLSNRASYQRTENKNSKQNNESETYRSCTANKRRLYNDQITENSRTQLEKTTVQQIDNISENYLRVLLCQANVIERIIQQS